METSTKRAAKGGELGANGEWYEGGKFINTIPENRKLEGSRRRKVRKVEIEPFVWVAPLEGKQSIYQAFAGIFGKVVNGRLEVLCQEQVFKFYGVSRDEVQAMADAYNAGERWVSK